jgi:hypothetical protein
VELQPPQANRRQLQRATAPLVYRKRVAAAHVRRHARSTSPLKDNIPLARFPVVTAALVAINVIA